jgi:hypothetical protein
LTSFGKAPSKTPTVVLRADLPKKLGKILCENRKALSTELSWKYGLNDAQLEGRFFVPTTGVKATTAEMNKRGQSLAKRMHHHGFAGGVCADGSGWAVSVPAPVEMKPVTDGRQNLPIAELATHCSDVAIDFAPAGHGLGKSLDHSKSPLLIQNLGAGTISISCLPRTPAWQGSVMWYLEPVNSQTVAELPSKAILELSEAPDLALAQWINELRKTEQLSPMIYGTAPLAAAANLLSIGGSILHNRKLLKNAKDILAESKFTLIGEDRVKADSLQLLAWHLWNSPRHRRLLLDRTATHFGISMLKQYDGLFAVITTGVGDNIIISGNSTSKPPL